MYSESLKWAGQVCIMFLSFTSCLFNNDKIEFFSGTNDAFVTIALGKEKYQTSVKEKATESVDWCEQCEL